MVGIKTLLGPPAVAGTGLHMEAMAGPQVEARDGRRLAVAGAGAAQGGPAAAGTLATCRDVQLMFSNLPVSLYRYLLKKHRWGA